MQCPEPNDEPRYAHFGSQHITRSTNRKIRPKLHSCNNAYLDPTDGPAWVQAILSHHSNFEKRVEVGTSVYTWPSYCAALKDFITAIG